MMILNNFNVFGIFKSDTVVVMLVNDLEIRRSEIQREMRKYRSKIYQEYAVKYNIKQDSNFWNQSFEGKSPLKDLQQLAIDSLVRQKVQEKLLIDRNLWPYTNYDELIKDMNHQNSLRKQAVANKQVIYGPITFTEQTFFDYQFSNAIIRLHEMMRNKEIIITDQLLITHYNKLKSTIYKGDNSPAFGEVKTRVADHYLTSEYNNLISALVKKADIKMLKKL